MSDNLIVTCIACGRDTKNKSGVCRKCFGGRQWESSGRKQLDHRQYSGSPFDVEEPDEDDPKQNYHGESIRDDI